MVRNAVLAKETAAVGGDKHIVLNANAAKVAVCVNLVKVEVLGVDTLLLPIVNEVGYKVDARFVGHHVSGLKAAAKAQGVGAKLARGTCLVVKTYIHLSEALHVVYVHAHHVAKAVGQEQGMGTGTHSLLGVALHQAEFLEAVGHKGAHCHVHVPPAHTRTGMAQGQVVTVGHNVVYLLLLGGKLAADRGGAGVV